MKTLHWKQCRGPQSVTQNTKLRASIPSNEAVAHQPDGRGHQPPAIRYRVLLEGTGALIATVKQCDDTDECGCDDGELTSVALFFASRHSS